MGESGGARSRGAIPVVLRLLLAVGFVIAVAATALVVFAEDVQMLRLAAVLALWAALIAAFAVTRFRRDARTAAMRQGEAQLAYQLELHREVSARREYEADLSRQAAAAQSDQLAELREELERLTGVLSSLAGGELTVSRLTLSAESARFRPGQQAVAASGTVTLGDGSGPALALAAPTTVDADDEPSPGTAGRLGGGSPAGADHPPRRPDAPAAAWARRNADRERARRAAPSAPLPAAPPPVVGHPGAPAGFDDHESTRPLPVVPPQHAVRPDAAHGASTGAVPVDRQRLGAEAPRVDADEPDLGAPGDHETGVSVADLMAAYGISGHIRRRRRD